MCPLTVIVFDVLPNLRSLIARLHNFLECVVICNCIMGVACHDVAGKLGLLPSGQSR